MNISILKTGKYMRSFSFVLAGFVLLAPVSAVFASPFDGGGSTAAPPAPTGAADYVGLYSETEVIEEVSPLKISLDANRLTGFLIAPLCHETCVDTRLTITPKTVAYDKVTKVPLKEAKSRLGRSAEIIYNTKTKEVVRISW